MNITAEQKKKIEQVINVFETGSRTGDYAKVTIYPDGKNGSRQITYGRSQTTEQGNLRELLTDYINAGPDMDADYNRIIKSCLADMGRKPLCDDTALVRALRQAGQTGTMQRVQDAFFDRRYWQPALKWATDNGFATALAMLVIYDSWIHSGGILDFLRNRFAAVPPAKGGDEEDWVYQYVDTRRKWLAGHSNAILRKTVYRMDTMLHAILIDNWDLSQRVRANGVTV